MNDPEAQTVVISREPMSLEELSAIARGAGVLLSDEAIERIRAARRVVEAALDGDELVYGLNTGLGHARNRRLPHSELRSLQPIIVAMHDGSMGNPLPKEVVRAAMAARLNGMARGGSGATVAAATTLEAMLNAGVHPVIPEFASVGAADLGHMAAIAMVAIGAGRAEIEGEEMNGPAAMLAANITPLAMEPKDALAMVSANGVTIGRGALVLQRALDVIDEADAVAAVSMEAFRGNPSIVEASVARAKSGRGQTETSRRIRWLLEGSDRCGPGAEVSVQDPLAFRVVPQVHGACRDTLAFAADALAAELNARSDNPLVSIEEGRLISNGNFHPMLVALSIDALRPAVAHVGQLSERRLGHLWDGYVGETPDLDPDELMPVAPEMAGLLLRYAAAARSTRLRSLADPVTLDVPPLDFGVEDHATNAPEAVQRTDESLDVLEEVLAVELLVANLVLDGIDPSPHLGIGTGAVVTTLREVLDGLPDGSPTALVHRHTQDLLASGMPPRDREDATSLVDAKRSPDSALRREVKELRQVNERGGGVGPSGTGSLDTVE